MEARGTRYRGKASFFQATSALTEDHLAAFFRDADGVAGDEIAREDLLGERVLDLLLDRALERARTVDRIEADFGDYGERRGRHVELDVELGEPRLEALELDLRDLFDVLFR